MDFAEVVARRRMVRRYLDEPVDEAFLRRALANATRAPSAGFTQGWSFLVLRTPENVRHFWESTSPEVEERPGFQRACHETSSHNPWLDGMKTAPVVIVVLASETAYRERYAENDKASATLRSADIPWWQIDAAMASMLILQTATDEGLGACFFGVPSAGLPRLRETFDIPAEFAPIGAITLGQPAPGEASGSPTRRARRPLDEVVHDGRWDQPITWCPGE